MSNLVEIRWHGRGGQGAKTASLLLADAAFNTGKYIQGFPEYGPERSQIQNRETAMKMLKSKLLDMKEREQKETINDLKGEQKDIAWGSQIRSYVFCPYTLVKDHRTNYETGNVQAVMDGDINEFMKAYLKLLEKHIHKVKTGLPGMAYIKIDDDAEWPEFLSNQVQL